MLRAAYRAAVRGALPLETSFVLGWTGDGVNPAELTEVRARAAVDAKQLAFERHLVDAARVQIADEEDGIGSRGHAQGIGRTRRLRPGLQIGAGFAVNDRPRRRHGHVDRELPEELS